MSKNETGKPLSWIERLVLKTVLNKITKKIDMAKGSYKTTMYAVFAALALVINPILPLLDSDPSTVFNMNALYVAVVGAIALFKQGQSSRDKDVSSQAQAEAGTKMK